MNPSKYNRDLDQRRSGKGSDKWSVSEYILKVDDLITNLERSNESKRGVWDVSKVSGLSN